ncbi:asparagine synthase [Microbacterium capsulatum]|uniref:Asparagine synthase n=1 Tax=Microbacterium capsulatum TaxID=3041921 RepID=A0ABU0XKF1_9MICO|nr:asparagine synthase [Microbacterium sp. ASV81]MDQ4215620.1 asparagine synthase [Microbacterium sp. ASV81]
MGKTADVIAEGVAIATSAARLVVKNHILVGTIAQGGSFDVAKYSNDAREALLLLAAESEEEAERTVSLRKRAHGRHSDPHGTHDYRERDVRNLKRRAKQGVAVADRLREMADDPETLRFLVEAARAAAWGDVASNLQGRLRVEAMRPDEDPDYETMRAARMQALRLVDLQELASEQRARRKRQEKADKAQEKADRAAAKEAVREEKRAARNVG